LFILVLLVVYTFAVLKLYWTKFAVPDGHFVLLNSDIKYEGERFDWYPSKRAKIVLVNGEIELEPFDCTLTLKDGTNIQCTIKTAVRLDIKSAMSNRQKITFDPAQALICLETDVCALLSAKAKDSETFSGFLSSTVANGKIKPGDFPYTWDPEETTIAEKMKRK